MQYIKDTVVLLYIISEVYMKEQISTYNLFSELKNHVILTICHSVQDEKCDCVSDNSMELLQVIEGKGRIILHDGTTIPVNGGDAFMFDSLRKYSLICDTPLEIFSLKFNASDFIDGEYHVLGKKSLHHFFSQLGSLREKMNGIHVNTRRIQEILFLLENEFQNKNRCSEYVIKAYVILLITLTVQYYFGESDELDFHRTAHYEAIEKTLQYIDEHISEKISLDTLARIANMGKTNYSVAFKQITGMTVWEYVLNARVELAAGYLVEKKDAYNMEEIAYRCGFHNSAHFNKTFKKIKGETPGDFKKNSGNPCF